MPVRLIPPSAGLEALVRAYVLRDTRDGPHRPGERRLNRYPALPLCSLNFRLHGETLRQPFAAGPAPRPDCPDLVPLPAVCVAGPNTRPIHTYDLAPVDTVTIAFYPPAFAALTGLAPADLVDRFEPGETVFDTAFGAAIAALARDLSAAPAAEHRVEVIEAFLLPRWQAVAHDPGTTRLGRLLARLSVRAAAALVKLNARTLERRFRSGFGLAPRAVRQLARAEAAFLHARDGRRRGDGANLAALAAEHGYADQAHLARDFRALAGEAPSQLLARAEADESYWSYRL